MYRVVPLIPEMRRFARLLVYDPGKADDLVEGALRMVKASGLDDAVADDLRVFMYRKLFEAFRGTPAHDYPLSYDRMSNSAAGSDGSTDQAGSGGLLWILSQLPTEQRIVILLVTVAKLSYEDVESISGQTVKEVSKNVAQARMAIHRFTALGVLNAKANQKQTESRWSGGDCFVGSQTASE